MNFVFEWIRIAPKWEAQYSEFVHHQLAPEIMAQIPEILAIRRYEEFGVAGSLAWFNKRYLLSFAIKSSVNWTEIKQKIERLPSALKFKKYRKEWLKTFEIDSLKQIYQHHRLHQGAAFSSRPFFIVMVDVKANERVSFDNWYHESYLPKTMGDIPMWCACRRYEVEGSKNNRCYTVYEAQDDMDLFRGHELLRAPYRFSSNEDWEQWVERALTLQDASSFRPILLLTRS